MTKENSEINWDKIMNKFSSYEGTIVDFCKENKVSQHQLYYRRKRLEKEDKPTFYAIALNNEETNTSTIKDNIKVLKDIRIEIGKANIYIPVNEIALLSNIVKELSKSC